MSQFRDIFATADQQIIARVGDDAVLDGVEVRGELAVPIESSGLSGSATGFQGYTFRLSDDQAASAAIGSVLVAYEKAYSVVNMYPEGTGMTTLELRLDEPG